MADEKQVGGSTDRDQQDNRGGRRDERDASRRTALRKIAAGLGMVGGTSALPERWVRPVIETIVRPASGAPTEMTPEPTTE